MGCLQAFRKTALGSIRAVTMQQEVIRAQAKTSKQANISNALLPPVVGGTKHDAPASWARHVPSDDTPSNRAGPQSMPTSSTGTSSCVREKVARPSFLNESVALSRCPSALQQAWVSKGAAWEEEPGRGARRFLVQHV